MKAICLATFLFAGFCFCSGYSYGNPAAGITLAQKEERVKVLEKKFNLEAFRKSSGSAGVIDLTVPDAQLSWEYADTIVSLGWDYDRAGEYEKGKICFQKNYELYKKAFGEERADTAHELNQLAMHYVREHNYPEAEIASKKCISIEKKLLGEKNPQLVFSLNTLFHVYQDQDRDREADLICKEQLSIAEAETGKNSVMVANLLEADAEVLNHMGKTSEAENAINRAITIRRLTKTHPEHKVDAQLK